MVKKVSRGANKPFGHKPNRFFSTIFPSCMSIDLTTVFFALTLTNLNKEFSDYFVL